jgi:hypothetical protein
MANGELSGSGGWGDWRFRLVVAAGGGAGMAVAMLVGSLADLHGFLPGLTSLGVGYAVGVFLGHFAGSHMFPRPPRHGSRLEPVVEPTEAGPK